MVALEDGPILRHWENDTKIVTKQFFGWLEREGTRREHFHWQVRRGRTVTPES